MNAGWYLLSEGPDGKREVAHDERFSSQADCEAYIRRHHIPAAGLLTAELWDGSRWIGLRALTGGCLAVGEQDQGSDSGSPTRLSGSHTFGRQETEAAKAKVLEELYGWTGSAFLAGEERGEIEDSRKAELYFFLCRLIRWFMPEEESQ